MAEPAHRTALVGCGMISLYHLRAWQEAGVPVVAVCDVDRARAEARAAEFGIGRVHDDPAALFAEGGFELVDIAASVEAHDPVTRMAADHGVHVLLQKPMTRTVAEAEALVETVGARIRFMVHENHRFRPHYMTVRRWLDEGRIGRIRHASMAVRGSGLCSLDGEEPFLLKRQPYLRGFERNLVFETMIHHLDVLRLLLGPLTLVAARLNRLADGLPGEDTATILLQAQDGRWPPPMAASARPATRPCMATGWSWSASAAPSSWTWTASSSSGTRTPPRKSISPAATRCFDRAIADFVRGIRDGTPFETDRLDNLETLRLMESVYDAAGVEVR